ncbi:Arm DNA-binding domain-containing protein [Budvicia aquatica]|uniref:Arm DNA-binding domain-containing protein n=1 Tax=Budvicia aquatica TaxID=82979 RepID=UPI00041CC083|nr:Arm DNA-binding domain-containing protein [Budvicia aquatica]
MQEIVLVKSGQDGLSVRVAYKGKITYQFRYHWGGKSERVDKVGIATGVTAVKP